MINSSKILHKNTVELALMSEVEAQQARLELIKKRRLQFYCLARNLAYIPDCHHYFVREMADRASIYHGTNSIIGGRLGDLSQQQEHLLSSLADQYLTPGLINETHSVKEDAQIQRMEHIRDLMLSLRENIEVLPVIIHHVIRSFAHHANIVGHNGVFGVNLAKMTDSQVGYYENLAEQYIKPQTNVNEATATADVCQQHSPSQMEP